ncbi:MAG: AcrR family transcriptional regulator [Myxococcota bacterium]|jgi:AcrR family transcriptional regulator
MARPKHDPDKAPTTERILSAAVDEFGEHGFSGARLSDIADLAGIRRQSVLYHFKSKEGLYAAVVEAGFVGLTTAAMRGMQYQGPFGDKLTHVVGELTRYAGAHLGLIRTVTREIVHPTERASEVHQRLSRLVDALVSFLEVSGSDLLRRDVPVRACVMQLMSGYLMRQAAMAVDSDLWGPDDPTLDLTRALLLKPVAPSSVE